MKVKHSGKVIEFPSVYDKFLAMMEKRKQSCCYQAVSKYAENHYNLYQDLEKLSHEAEKHLGLDVMSRMEPFAGSVFPSLTVEGHILTRIVNKINQLKFH